MTSPFLASYIVLWVVMVVQSVAIFALYHHFGQVYLQSREGRATQGPAVDTSLKRLDVQDVMGTPLSLPMIGRPLLMVFATTTCPLCDKLRPALGYVAESAGDVEVLVICGGEREVVRRWAQDLGARVRVVPDPGYRIAAHYTVGLTPFGVGTDRDGMVRAKGLVNDQERLEGMVQDTLFAGQAQAPLEVLKEVPGHVKGRIQVGSHSHR